MFGDPPRLWCLVVDAGVAIVGYATYSLHFSTWRGADYLHIDCLYLHLSFRHLGIGTDMMNAIAEHARVLGCEVLQWQTPVWNAPAARFYDRLGATRLEKLRYSWSVQ
jgi:GNAT superfamily N-acetyltransferase